MGTTDRPVLVLRLLGGFHVERSDVGALPAHWRRPSAQAVVKVLGLEPNLRLHRDEVLEKCWPDSDPEDARRNLRVCLHAARREFEPDLPPRVASSYLITDGEMILLHADRVQVDVSSARAAATAALGQRNVDALHAALETLSAELLPEDRYAVWAIERRAELAALRQRVAVALSDAQLAAGRPLAAVETLERACQDDALDEEIHRRLLAACHEAGQHQRAAAHYRRLAETLRRELGIPPDPATREAHERAMRDALHRSLRTLAAVDGAPLPAPELPAAARRLTVLSLPGRERVIADIIDELAPPDAAGNHGVRRSEAPPLFLLCGESGLGKTTLAAAAARAAVDRGVTVIWGAAHEAEGPLPYGAFAEALSGWFADRLPGVRADAAARYPEIGFLAPDLGRAPEGSRTAEEERARLFGAVGALIVEAARERPVLFVLDDLHAADVGTVQLLHHLVRTLAGHPIRFLATLRDEALEDGDARGALLAAAARQGLSRRIELTCLSRADSDRLAIDITGALDADPPTPDVLETVYRVTKGNPLFASELVRAMTPSAGATGQDAVVSAPIGLEPALPGFPEGVPVSVRDVVATRIARFDGVTTAVLRAVAAAQGPVPLAEVTAVAGTALHPPVGDPALTAALDTLVHARVLDECQVASAGSRVPGLTFRHPVVGMAVYDRLTTARQRSLHLAHATAIQTHRPSAVDAIARHLALAEAPDAPAWLRRAAERAAALYADDSASRYYSALIARLEAGADLATTAAEVAGIELAWAEVLIRQAQHEHAEQVIRKAMGAFAVGNDPDGTALATALLAESLGRRGESQQGLALLLGDSKAHADGAGSALPPRASGRRAAASYHLVLARLLGRTGRYREGLAQAAQAVDCARRLGDDAEQGLMLGRALDLRSACLSMLGRPVAARRAAEEAWRLAHESGDLPTQSRAFSTLRETAERAGRLEQAEHYGRRAMALAERTGDPLQKAFEQANLARLHVMAGNLEAAREGVDRAVATARPYGSVWSLPYCLIVAGEVDLMGGDPGGARRWLEQAAALAEALGDGQAIAEARMSRAELELVEGNPEQAVARVQDADPDDFRALVVLAQAAATAQQTDEAVELAERALRLARASQHRPAQVKARRILGLAYALRGQAQDARLQFRWASRLAAAMGHHVARAQIRGTSSQRLAIPPVSMHRSSP